MRSLALSVLLLAATAHADVGPAPADDLAAARADIVDARYGRQPQRVQLLGFDAEGAAYVRVTLCEVGDASGLLSCKVAVHELARDGRRTVTTLLDVSDSGCEAEPCPGPITYTVARDFLAAERAFRAALPPLTPGVPVDDAARALGDDVRLDVVADEGVDAPGRLRLVARQGKVRTTLWSRPATDERTEGRPRWQAWTSPDGARVVLAASFGTGMMCWGPFAEQAVVQVDPVALRARLRRS